MGMIVSNAFMKRSFGKKLIENYLRHKDLTHIIDTSGVYLPGHGTPTTILLRTQPAARCSTRFEQYEASEVRTECQTIRPTPLFGVRSLTHVAEPDFEGERVSVADAHAFCVRTVPLEALGGGGAGRALEEQIQERIG
jgi:hypothetical protein